MQLYLISGERLAKDVNKKLKKLQQLARQVFITHGMEDIHQMRVTYKKLRALVRMANVTGRKKGIHPGLKKLYTAAGTVRDLQIHHETVSAYFSEHGTMPVHYLQQIQGEIKESFDELTKTYKQFSFSRARKLVQVQLPKKLRREALIKWHEAQTDAIKITGTPPPDDEWLHDIRKHIKDLRYTADYILPTNDYKAATDVLGDFMDSCVLLTLLDKYISKAPPDEVTMLTDARQHWEADKMALKEQAIKAIAQISGQ